MATQSKVHTPLGLANILISLGTSSAFQEVYDILGYAVCMFGCGE